MREIKFRGQRKDNREWVHGWYVEINSKSYICNEIYAPLGIFYFNKPNGERINLISNLLGGLIEVIPETVGQFTGFKDKDFWEGDTLESQDGLRRYTIAYSEQQMKWYLKGIGKAWDDNNPAWRTDYKKISNIHEPPKLLEANSA